MQGTPRIGNVTAGMMLAGALVLDFIQFLLTLSVFLEPLSFIFTFLGAITFGLWFTLLGVRYIGNDGGKKLLIGLGATVAEFIPIINALPVTTAGVFGIIAQSRVEDARRNTGERVTPRTAMAVARAQKMRAARTQRANVAREEREEAQSARHADGTDPVSTNDNTQEERVAA